VSEVPNQLRANDVLANERTYLAYVRTALAFIAFGFVVARFSLFTREFSEIARVGVPKEGASTAFGTAMASFGIVIALIGTWRYGVTDRGLREGRVIGLSARGAYVISLVVVAIGAVVAMALLGFR
jgi:putative membrane protein